MTRKPLQALLRWYASHGRDLPWRKTRDPYAILVSEVMLQQTQVSRVISYYRRWLRRFPDWQSLAAADTGEVLRLWSGLGYNRRALMLQAAAKQVAAEGEPRTREGWLAVKGVGPYTSAAVSMFAFKQKHLPVDTNIRRVLGRLYLGRPFPSPAADGRITKLVEPELEHLRAFYDLPQALFDLANAHCFKKPACASCPVRSTCLAAPKFLSGRVRIPKRSVVKTLERIRAGKRYPDRIYRGRILKLAQATSGAPLAKLGKAIDPSFDGKKDRAWLLAMIERMRRDGLIRIEQDRIMLP